MSLDLWHRSCERLATELPEQQFSTWIRPLPPADFTDEGEGAVAHVRVPNRFKLDWIRSQYSSRIESVLTELAGKPVRLELALAPRETPAPGHAQVPTGSGFITSQPPQRIGAVFEQALASPANVANGHGAAIATPARPMHIAPAMNSHRLNPALTFDTLVAGRANQMARTAALHVAGAPGAMYNPLFVYGGVGLGKTHLVHAVGNRLLADKPNSKVLYIHAEQIGRAHV